jgi:hypothetical protein
MKLPFTLLLLFLFIGPTFSQTSARDNYDSLWYFHPFSIDLSAGLWIPAGKLATYYRPSAQFGGSFGLMVTKRMRFQLWIMPRLLQQEKSLSIKVNDSSVQYKKNLPGASLGGWMSFRFYQDKFVSSEILTGVTWETIPTTVQKPGSKDSLSVSGVGLSVGVNSWINIFPRSNIGVKAVYTYSTYDRSKNLSTSIGGHSITISLAYRFPRRNQNFKRWY